MALSRDQIKEVNDSNAVEFYAPEWGEEPLLLACPSVKRLAEISDAGEDVDPVTLLIACAVDAEGAALFVDDDREWLETKNAAVLGRVVKRMTQMFEDLEGNLNGAQGGASSSD